MKKVLLTLTVIGTLFLGACEKEELATPSDKTLIKTDKGILCRGCGQWDIIDQQSESEGGAFRSAATTDTTSTPVKIIKRGNR